MYPTQDSSFHSPIGSTLGGVVGTTTPKVASVVENELQGLNNSTRQLTNIVNALYSRLAPLLRQPNPKAENSEKDQIELAPIAQSIKINKESVFKNVFAIKDLLERLEV